MGDLLLKTEVVWFLAGFVLLISELISPGFIILFFGFGAWTVSLICFFFDPGINFQLTIFLVSSIIYLLLLRKWLSRALTGKKEDNSDDGFEDLKGEKAVVSKDILPGSGGRVFFRGCEWEVDSEFEIKKEAHVVIKDSKSIKLIVEPILKKES